MVEETLKHSLLSQIDCPADLKKLSVDQLPEVCAELRQEIIDVLSHNPGHLGSSLGAIELTVALHYCFDTPTDRLVWDVGHQAYAHKILTGRRDAFKTNRQLGGLKPFPSPTESEYDTCTCGHASNSISMGLGMAVAARLHNKRRRVVSVIGDGALSGGLAFEGLNNVASTPNDLLIILNDNDMSIDDSVGGMKQYLLKLHTSNTYNRLRDKTARKLSTWGWLNDKRKKTIRHFNNSIKSLLFHQKLFNLFEGLDIRYFGPADGHDVKSLVRLLNKIKDMSGPRILHINTVKGKGYEAAERSATIWHAPGKFDVNSGKRLVPDESKLPCTYSKIFGQTLLELAKQNPRIVGVTPAMPTGSGLDVMMAAMPERTFDVGIAEGHALTFSAGLAKDGMIPFCTIYSSFAQRAYDNLIHDAAILNLPVVLCLDRAGLVGEDGPTHHGAFDIAAMRTIPNLTIASPMDEHEMRHLMYTAQLEGKGTFVIRYPRGRGEHTSWRCPMQEIAVGTGRKLKDGSQLAVLTYGPIGNVAARAIARIDAQGDAVAHYDMRFVKPLDEALLQEVGTHFQHVVTIEDGSLEGGFGSAVLEWLSGRQFAPEVTRLGLPDQFVEHGRVDLLYREVGLDENGIATTLQSLLEQP